MVLMGSASPVTRIADIAHTARVKELQLFHHVPEEDDAAIDRKVTEARAFLEGKNSTTSCLAPAEGTQRFLSGGAIGSDRSSASLAIVA